MIAYAVAAVGRPLPWYMGAAVPVSSRTLYAMSKRINVFEKRFQQTEVAITGVAVSGWTDAGRL
jgi:hypothetical protein